MVKNTVILKGSLTIQRAAEIRKILLQAFAAGKILVISFLDVEAVDMSLLQILCALHQSARRDKKQLILQGPLPEMFRQAVKTIGFEREVSCTHDGAEDCLWKEITKAGAAARDWLIKIPPQPDAAKGGPGAAGTKAKTDELDKDFERY